MRAGPATRRQNFAGIICGIICGIIYG